MCTSEFYSLSLASGFPVTTHDTYPQIVVGGDGLQIWKVVVHIVNKQLQVVDEGWFSMLQNVTQGRGCGQILRSNLSSGK
jgi:hypothetical protein